jgi:LPS sulfotransferase NodH
MMDLIAQGEKSWLKLYENLGVEYLQVAYEDLMTSEGYAGTVRRVLRHLDLDDNIEISPPRTDRQSDRINDEWVDRFLHERRIRSTS